MSRRTRVQHWGRVIALVLITLIITACGGTGQSATVGTALGAAPTATVSLPTPTTAPTTAPLTAPTTAPTVAATATNPPPTATALPPTRTPIPPTATPLPVLVETRNVATTKNTSGQFLIIGEFANIGQGDVGELKVLLSVIDGAGKTVAAPTAVIATEALAPGEKTVWQATVTEKLDAIAEVRAQAQATRLGATVRDRLYKDLKVAGVNFSAQAGQPPTIWVGGQIANTGSASATVGIWMAAYGADGKLTHVSLDTATRLYQLPSGKEQPFLIELAGLSEPPVRYEFWLRGSKREASFSSQVVDLETQKVNVIKNPGTAPAVVGEVSNPGKADVAGFTLVISFLDDAGKTVGVGSGSLATNLLPPGERTVWRSSFFSGMTDKTAFKDVRVQVQSLVASDATKRMSVRDLKVEGETLAPTGGANSYFRVNGQLVNKGGQATQSAVIYIAISSADGKLLLVQTAFPQTGQIPAGGSSPFTIDLISTRELPAKYEFFIVATRAN